MGKGFHVMVRIAILESCCPSCVGLPILTLAMGRRLQLWTHVAHVVGLKIRLNLTLAMEKIAALDSCCPCCGPEKPHSCHEKKLQLWTHVAHAVGLKNLTLAMEKVTHVAHVVGLKNLTLAMKKLATLDSCCPCSEGLTKNHSSHGQSCNSGLMLPMLWAWKKETSI